MAPQNDVIASLPTTISKVFDQVQSSVANHQKNCVALSKLHVEAAKLTEDNSSRRGGGTILVGEKAFEDVFISMVMHALPVKKGVTVADRVVKFVGSYVKAISERVKNGQAADLPVDDEDDEDTVASRFVVRLLGYLLKGFEAKDKNVRYRVVQLVSEIISYIGEVDESVYTSLRISLVARLHDKEANVRSQAVIALCKLLRSESDEDVLDLEESLQYMLLEVLACDPSADVRKTVLTNLPVESSTIPTLLARCRDIDDGVRKAVYSTLTEHVEHPKQFKFDQREKLVQDGISDRESAVRIAASKLIGGWLDVVKDMSSFIDLFMYMETDAAETAILSVFETRPDIFDNLEFKDTFWEDLTPQNALLGAVFVEHCVKLKDEARVESCLPVVTALAFKLQSLYNDLMQRLQTQCQNQDSSEDVRQKSEEEILAIVFTIGQLLRLSLNLDYADEIGRRKMYALVKDMISQDTLPEILLPRCLDILRKLSSSERDLIRVVVEVVHELRDAVEGDNMDVEPTETPSESLSTKKDWIDLKCLTLCIGTLERVNSTFEENSTLEGILGELIIPAVRRKELHMREKGLICLGLCCLIAKRMALSSFQLFLNQIQSAPEALQIRILHIVFDILMVHERELLADPKVGGDKVVDFLRSLLESDVSPKAQAVLSIGLAKLSLSGMVPDGTKVLETLVLVYFSPETSDNQELRQALSYFFPVYCYSSSLNQRRLQSIFLPVLERLSEDYRSLDDHQTMVEPANIGRLLLDWTDPEKAFKSPTREPDLTVHLDLAIDLLKKLFDSEMEKDDRKALCMMLPRLYMPDEVDDDKIRTLKLLVNNIRSRRPIRDTVANNTLTRLDASISKRFAKQLESLSDEDLRKLEELDDLFKFLDEIIPDSDIEEVIARQTEKKTSGRKRRSESIVTTTTAPSVTGDDVADVNDVDTDVKPVIKKEKGKTKAKAPAKKQRVSKSDSDSDSIVEVTPPPERRSMPRRAAATRKPQPIAVIELSSDSESQQEEVEEDDDDDFGEDSDTPKRGLAGKLRARNPRRETTETVLDADINALLEDVHNQSIDSIMDSDKESDEAASLENDEVEGLL